MTLSILKRPYLSDYLSDWLNRSNRKPLVIRGARQVGKTHLVEHWGQAHFERVLRLDLERSEDLRILFRSRNVKAILSELTLLYDVSFENNKTLLFLDEIQACPEAFQTLRYFFEDVPRIPIIAAGSLLDLVIESDDFSMPVGRVEFLHMHPFGFEEFLDTTGESNLARYLKTYQLTDVISEPVHNRLKSKLREYFFVGGMPEAVRTFIAEQSADAPNLKTVHRVQSSLVEAFENDFSKYKKKADVSLLRQVYRWVPRHLGERIKYSTVAADYRAIKVREAIDLLELARIITIAQHSSGTGIPLGSEINEKRIKAYFLDIGLAVRSCDFSLRDIDSAMTNMEGALCEQFAAQQMLIRDSTPFAASKLYFWTREEPSSNAEVDFLMEGNQSIIPVEIKAGPVGHMKSLLLFLNERKNDVGIRLDLALPRSQISRVGNKSDEASYLRVVNLPLYLAGQIHRLVQDL